MKHAVVQVAWLVQIVCLLAMVVVVLSRPAFRTLLKQTWKPTVFRWLAGVFLFATCVVLAARLLTTMGIG